MKFLRSRYVLMLLLTVLAIEVVMRMGVYEPVVSPASHSGKTITLKRALKKFGKDRVDALTFGDSRAAHGLDNQMIYEASREYALNHMRMSMPGSHLLTYKVLANWSVSELSKLRGIVLAVSPESFGNLGNGAYELAKVLPFRSKTSIGEMLHHVPFRRSDIRTYAPFYTISGYREDIKDLLTNPAMRVQKLGKRNRQDPLHDLAFNAWATNDTCYVSTANHAECLDDLAHLQADIPQRTSDGLEAVCKTLARESKQDAPGRSEEKLIGEWVNFLVNLSKQVRVMLVMLPDHSIRPEHTYAANAIFVANAVMNQLGAGGGIDLVDLRDLMANQDERECDLYMDAVHLNKKGKQILTTALIPELELFWSKLQRPEN